MKRLLAIALLALAARPAAGQVADDLRRAIAEYEKTNVEQAKQIFATILASRQVVTTEQRVTAYKYLGAYWALSSLPGARDSANSFFVAAIDYDPFTNLDPNVFAPDEVNAFARARRAIFRVGIQPPEPKALYPTTNADSSTYTFQIVSTRPARMTATIVKLGTQNVEEVVATMNSEGVRPVIWNGLVNNQRADTGLYEFRLDATDAERSGTTPVTERQRFRVDHLHARLEDSIPPFRDVLQGFTDTLRSRYSGARPWKDGAKGAVIASLAGALPFIAMSQYKNMSGWQSHFGIGIALGAVAGGGAAMYATSHRDDARAVAENARRRQLRAQFNAGVAARNADRLQKTILIIRPLTSATGG